MISFTRDEDRFNFRVAGIAIHNGRVLLHTTLKDDFWNLPGGRVEFHETTEQALIREIKEELDIDIQIERLIYVRENFFEYDRMNYHEIGLYYLFSIPSNHKILKESDKFYGVEDKGRLIYRWFDTDELKGIKVYPEEIRNFQAINEIRTIKHIVHNQ